MCACQPVEAAQECLSSVEEAVAHYPARSLSPLAHSKKPALSCFSCCSSVAVVERMSSLVNLEEAEVDKIPEGEELLYSEGSAVVLVRMSSPC